MAGKLNHTSEELLDLVFKKNVKGYDADQVDMVLDQIIEDYAYYEKFRSEAAPYIVELEKKNRTLGEEVKRLEMVNAQYKNRLDGIKDNAQVSTSNIEYLNRINKLEKELYKHGVDPTRIK